MNMLSNQLDIEKLRKEITETGMKAMQDIMNAVAPPIAEHEVIQVNLSHDMLGYEGVETLVYRALAKVCALTVCLLPELTPNCFAGHGAS